MHSIGGVSDRRHDSLYMQYIDKESCHRLTETPPMLCIKHVDFLHKKDGLFGTIIHKNNQMLHEFHHETDPLD